MKIINIDKPYVPKSYIEAGERVLELTNLNNIQVSNFNNFIYNIIPSYMNRTIDYDYFTVTFSDWFIDTSEIPSDKRCTSQKLTREASLNAIVDIDIKNFSVVNKKEFDNIAYSLPVEITRFPIISEQGSFIIKGVDRVMISHLEDAKGINIYKKENEIGVSIHTSLSPIFKIHKDKNSKYIITMPHKTMEDRYVSDRDSKKVENYNLFSFLSTLGINTIEQIKEITGENFRMVENYEVGILDMNGEEVLKNLELTISERERVNQRLSFKNRLVGRKLSREVKTTDKIYKPGTKVSIKIANELQNSGIIKVYVETPLGEYPVYNNGFVPADTLFSNKESIPEFLNHYDVNSKEKVIDGYYNISSDEFNKVVEKSKEYGLDLKSFLKVNFNNIVGTHLTKNDLVAILNLFSFVELGFDEIDDRDSLTNKSLVNISTIFEELLANQVFGLKTGGNSFREKIVANLKQFRIQNTSNPSFKLNNLNCDDQSTITSKLLRDPLNKLFHLEQNINPMDEISHKRRISLVKIEGRGGISQDRAMAVPRSVNPSHMGRICPIESPEGESIGLVLNLATLARVNEYDMIEAPFFRVDHNKQKIDLSKVYYMTYDEEQRYNRAIVPQIAEQNECYVSFTKKGVEVDRYELQPLYQMEDEKIVLMNKNDLEDQARELFRNKKKETNDGIDAYKLVIARKDWFKDELVDCAIGNGVAQRLRWDDIDFVTCRGEHIFSVVGSVLPFPEYDDGTRLMMGISMSKQTEPTIKSEEPLISTPISGILGRESMGVIKSPCDAVIVEVNSKYIRLVPIADENNSEENEIVIPLEQCKISDAFTKISNIPNVEEGDVVLKGDIIAGSEATADGKIGVGNNLLVGYMPWEGYNYEDAIVISDRMVRENVLTSFRVTEYIMEFNTDYDHRIESAVASEKFDFKKFRQKANSDGIIKVGNRVKTGDTLALKYVKYPDRDDLSPKELKYTGIDEGIVTRIVPNFVNKGLTTYSIQITTKEKIKIGDKLAGRHGNKGVIGKILPEWQMPYLEDGTPLDILLTPLGIPSRMNIGQLLESQIGLILKEAGLRAVNLPGKNLDIPRLKSLLNDYTGDDLGKIQLYDGRTGEPFSQKCNVGVTTMNKLKHLAAHKVAARSTGDFSQYDTDGMPKKGKKNLGGQRMGEMEMWVLEAHGASSCAKELFTYKTDDVANREIFKSKLRRDNLETLDFKQNFTNSYRRVISYIQSMGISVDHLREDNEIVDIYKDVSSAFRRNSTYKNYNETRFNKKEEEKDLNSEDKMILDKVESLFGGYSGKFDKDKDYGNIMDAFDDVDLGFGKELEIDSKKVEDLVSEDDLYEEYDEYSLEDNLKRLSNIEVEDYEENEKKLQQEMDKAEYLASDNDMNEDSDEVNDELMRKSEEEEMYKEIEDEINESEFDESSVDFESSISIENLSEEDIKNIKDSLGGVTMIEEELSNEDILEATSEEDDLEDEVEPLEELETIEDIQNLNEEELEQLTDEDIGKLLNEEHNDEDDEENTASLDDDVFDSLTPDQYEFGTDGFDQKDYSSYGTDEDEYDDYEEDSKAYYENKYADYYDDDDESGIIKFKKKGIYK